MGSCDIPFLDLATPHRDLQEELVAVFRQALNTARFIGGCVVEQFEEEFARYCGVPFCAGVGSGTDAVRFALMVAGVGPGEIVITVANTFIATTEAISQAGAQPRFVDVDERTYNMNPIRLREYLEERCRINSVTGVLEDRDTRERVRAIIPVHLYGQMADMDSILEIAEHYGLLVIEDACQAHGAMYFSNRDRRWHKAGSMGLAAAFSFYPGKNLGACGEAGAVTTADEQFAAKIRMVRDHGQSQKYCHDIEGYNGRLDAVQAGILSVKLRYLPDCNEQRRRRAEEYNRLLQAAGDPVEAPFEPAWSRAVYHIYAVRTDRREGMMRYLNNVGVGTGIHYPVPLHLQKAYSRLNYAAGDFPVSERAARQILSLPMYPHLRSEQQSKVIEELSRFVSGTTGRFQAREIAPGVTAEAA